MEQIAQFQQIKISIFSQVIKSAPKTTSPSLYRAFFLAALSAILRHVQWANAKNKDQPDPNFRFNIYKSKHDV